MTDIATTDRPHVLPGEHMGSADRLVQEAAIAQLFGISPEAVFQSRFGAEAIPLWPRTEADEFPDGKVRWSGLMPSACWHPFVWLNGLADRYVADDGTVESDDAWSIRMWLELTARGAIDVKTGGIVDVLSLIGLDADDERTQARLQSWLDGDADPLFEEFDLTLLLPYRDEADFGAPDWARRQSLQMISEMADVVAFTDIEKAREMLASMAEQFDDPEISGEEFKSLAIVAIVSMVEAFANLQSSFGGSWAQMSDEWTEDIQEAAITAEQEGTHEAREQFRHVLADVCAEATAEVDRLPAPNMDS